MANRFRAAKWLSRNDRPPTVYLFRHIETGQVLYSQFPHYTDYQIKKQFQRPNWENRKPSTRRDAWRIMAVAQFPTYDLATEAYESLVTLRHYREKVFRKKTEEMRRRDHFHNIAHYCQFRPTWSQEAVADLASVTQGLKNDSVAADPYKVGFGKIKIYWEDEWRKGDLKHWVKEVEHTTFPRFNLREESVILQNLGEKIKQEFDEARVEANRRKQLAAVELKETPRQVPV